VSVEVAGCYFDHFERWFPDRLVGREIFRDGVFGGSLQVLLYDRVFEGCRVFTTIGMAHVALAPLCEWMVVTDREWDAIPRVLAACAFSAMYEGWNGWGYGVRDIGTSDAAFAARTGKQHLYLTLPHSLPEYDFHRVSCGGREARVFQAIFVTEGELRYLSDHGIDAFEARMEREELDLYDPSRPEMRLDPPDAR
jgi:hypothetical protein